MASTLEARRLTEAHRFAQARIGEQASRLLVSTWDLLDPADIDRTVDRWLRAAVPVVRSQRVASGRMAAAYYEAFRAMETRPDRRFLARPVQSIPLEQVVASLVSTGPARVKAATSRGADLTLAGLLGQQGAAGAAMRLTLDAGRQTITTSSTDDQRALGWARAASGDPCAFCLLLASRGPVYSEQSADFAAHDHCTCGAEPVFFEDAPWPPGSREAADLYAEAASGAADPMAAFRQAVAQRSQ